MDYQVEVMRRLAKPFNYEWRGHGIGMLRTYLDEEKTIRLNLWHHRLLVPGISTLHTHPWYLTSSVVAGRIGNVRWLRNPQADKFMEGRINCIEFAGIEGEPVEVGLERQETEWYGPGTGYKQEPAEIHSTEFEDGTATIMRRQGEHMAYASVFWRVGEEYGDATRDVTTEDIVETISAVRRQMGL